MWRKSSYSPTGSNCVEVNDNWVKSSHSMSNGNCLEWRKSTYSTYNGNCVEVAQGVCIRDSKDPEGPVLHFTATAWKTFLATL